LKDKRASAIIAMLCSAVCGILRKASFLRLAIRACCLDRIEFFIRNPALAAQLLSGGAGLWKGLVFIGFGVFFNCSISIRSAIIRSIEERHQESSQTANYAFFERYSRCGSKRRQTAQERRTVP